MSVIGALIILHNNYSKYHLKKPYCEVFLLQVAIIIIVHIMSILLKYEIVTQIVTTYLPACTPGMYPRTHARTTTHLHKHIKHVQLSYFQCGFNLIPEEGHLRPKRWIKIQNKRLPNKVDVSRGCDFSTSTINF